MTGKIGVETNRGNASMKRSRMTLSPGTTCAANIYRSKEHMKAAHPSSLASCMFFYHSVHDVAGVGLRVVFADADEPQPAIRGRHWVHRPVGEAVQRVGGEGWA